MAVGDKVFIADKTTQDLINTNVGSNADASNASGSVHAKIKSAQGTLNTVNSNVSSMFSNVGNNNDASNASGSVHAKLKDIKATLTSSGNGYSSKAVRISATSSATALLSLSGNGVVPYIAFASQGSTATYEILVDGAIVHSISINTGVSRSIDDPIYFKNSFLLRNSSANLSYITYTYALA